jgi:hypothetical protein
MDYSDLNSAVLDEFGESITYRVPGDPNTTAITGVFRDEVAETESPGWITELFMSADAIAFDAERGHQILRGTDTYTVIDYSRDAGRGLTLKLRRV